MSEVEVLPANDVLTCLWNKNADEKCRIGLSDCVIYDGGTPARWYFTGKTGEILKKRAVDYQSISTRWKRICGLSQSSTIAIVRQRHGIYKFLSEEGWDAFVAQKGTADNSVTSVHCFIKGTNQTIYRNNFELKDKLGRCVTSTYSYTYSTDAGAGPDAFALMTEESRTFVESKATSLKNIMDLATNTIVRYVETMMNIKIMKISVDFVIDTKSQLWCLWTSDAMVCRAATLEDIHVKGFPSGDRSGRGLWLGPKYEEGVVDLMDRNTRSRGLTPNRSKDPIRRFSPERAVEGHYDSLPEPGTMTPHQSSVRTGSPSSSRRTRSPVHVGADGASQTSNTHPPASPGISVTFDEASMAGSFAGGDVGSVSSYADSTTRNLGRARSRGEGDTRNLPPSFSQKLRPDRDSGYLDGTETLTGVRENKEMNPPLNMGSKVGPTKGRKQVLAAAGVLDEVSERAQMQTQEQLNGTHRQAPLEQSITLNKSKNTDFKPSQYPDAFACQGQYCKLAVAGIGPLGNSQHEDADEHVGEKLFTQKELRILKKNPNFNAMMDFSADGPGTALVAMKSIIMAAREMRLDSQQVDKEDWRKYPLTPRSKHDLSTVLRHIEREAMQDDDEASLLTLQKLEQERQQNQMAILKRDKEQRDNFTKNMASYYKQVRVCGTCCKVYALLDWSRALLGFDDAYGAGVEGKGAAARSAQAGPNLTQKRLSRKSTNRRKSQATDGTKGSEDDWWTSEEHTPRGGKDGRRSASAGGGPRGGRGSSPGKTPNKYDATGDRRAAKGQRQRAEHEKLVKEGKKTWKDYAYDPEGKPNPNMKQIGNAQFRDIDAYMRGGAYKLTKRKEKEREEAMKKRVSELVKEEQEIAMWEKKKKKEATRGEFDFSDDESDDDALAGNADDIAKNMYCGKVLLVYQDREEAYQARQFLEETYFKVTWSKDGRQALNDFFLAEGDFDCVLVQRDIPLADAFAITGKVREFEKRERHRAAAQMAEQGLGRQPNTKRRAVICYTADTAPEDLKLYMKADMDGCVSVPPSKVALLNTVRAAVPHHLAILAEKPEEPDPRRPQVFHMQDLGVLEGAQDSATVAAQTLPIAQGSMDEEYAFGGVVQIDADTRVPYQILDAGRNAKVLVNPKKPFFNLVVCHDLFDTYEKMKIFFKPIIQKYLGMQILVWNYPGQAFSEWREEQLLNNEYHATCLNEVLGQLGENGTGEFDTSRPFFMLGYGHGLSVASFYAAYYAVPNLRGVISVNGWAFVDSYLAGAMHDCGNIFHCAPSSRPDLPVYFFSRFLFSKDYLARVSVPLALNIYTAIHNPITLTGRINLTKGVLAAVDVRPLLKEIECPVIAIHSTEDSFARPLHTEPLASCRGGEVRSIHKVLKNPTKTCVIWMKSGHEIFQESKKEIQMLLEQILTGFHESHDISFPPAPMVDAISTDQGTLMSNLPSGQNSALANTVEDKFIDNVLGRLDGMASTLTKDQQKAQMEQQLAAIKDAPTNAFERNSLVPVETLGGTGGRAMSPSSRGNLAQTTALTKTRDINQSNREIIFSSSDPGVWNDFSSTIAEGQVLGKLTAQGKNSMAKWGKNKDPVTRVFDPTLSNFERQDSVVYGQDAIMKKHQDLNPADFPEVKEYMGWRLKRNKKRLQRLQGAARTIQGGFRAYLARNFVKAIRRRKAASKIQRAFRGWIGRCAFLDQARRIWGSQMIQRAWRGYLGRKWFFYLRLRIAAAANIQRVFRGHLGRVRVQLIKDVRHHAACIIQALYRAFAAKKGAMRMREMRNCSIVIQRMYRGHLGRRKALSERDKYIFSRSQSQGIEFGRQMLLEHKLHATKLQSDVTLLTGEKVAAEEQVEALLEEISSFEEGVRVLEKEMHQLSKVESEAAAFMDEESKMELREQKMRLDKEFGEMLAKIGNRKDMLNDLEHKLSTIDKSRQGKEEELRVLERKLVVLLEEQQNELAAIKRKQDVRGALLAASHDEMMKITTAVPGGNAAALTVQAETAAQASNSLTTGGGGGGGGPSLQEKKQAAQLMQSTETLMKFGFMSMSMTYFSSLNMIKALRTVSAQDTVMAALADVHSQRAAGGGGSGGGDAMSGMSSGGSQYMPELKAGQLPGQEALRVSSWSVEDVAKWLQTLSLGQYSEAFLDAAVDGEFLYDLNDDDLKNTLGIEHKLHRKKILGCVHRLKIAEAQADNRINELLKSGNLGELEEASDTVDDSQVFKDGQAAFSEDLGGPALPGDSNKIESDGPKVPLNELFSLVRHSKISLIKEALDFLPNKKFDKTLVQAGYVMDNGTVYSDGYERLPFHINKVDEHGNTMLSLSAQNGNMKISKYLLAKGANPNHQNLHGQTPAHFAIAYKFFELSQYIFEHGGDDTLENKYGLTAYDGLSNEDD